MEEINTLVKYVHLLINHNAIVDGILLRTQPFHYYIETT